MFLPHSCVRSDKSITSDKYHINKRTSSHSDRGVSFYRWTVWKRARITTATGRYESERLMIQMALAKQQSKAILLHLPAKLLHDFDRVATAFGLSRSETIRRSLMRDVAYIMERELPKATEEQQRRVVDHRSWLVEQETCA
jgi:hypothetical protein